MNPAAAAYVARFLEDSLGLPEGSVDPASVPSELAAAIGSAMGGAENSASAEPRIELMVLDFLEDHERRWLDATGFSVRKARWPGGARYAACLTHDVDNIERPWSHVAERRERFSTRDYWLARLGIISLYNNLSRVADMESRRGLRSSFYLLSSNYDLSRLSKELSTMKTDGWEIGLHGDFGTHDSEQMMKEAAERFEKGTGIRPVGLREHYLQFAYPQTWEIARSAGFRYDSTVGNRDQLGFRLGLCVPFRPPGRDWSAMDLLELPLVLMDTTLWGYLKRTEEEGLNDFRAMKNGVARVNGLFTLLWHQESVRMRGGRIYGKLLDELRADGCFIASGDAISTWWRARSAPLKVEANKCSLDGAPEGLVLLFKAKGERKASVEGGVIETRGSEATIRVTGPRFRMKVE